LAGGAAGILAVAFVAVVTALAGPAEPVERFRIAITANGSHATWTPG
jgi:hypothetical protein